jgi:quercetin dioxygenase-like cupin family protein
MRRTPRARPREIDQARASSLLQEDDVSAVKAPIAESKCIVGVDAAKSSYMTTAGTNWETAGDGMWVKKIYEDAARAESTMLFRMEPGAYSPPHSHDAFEQVYVLEGSFYDEDRLVRAGEFCARSPGAMHSASSDDGALMLVVYTRA